MKRVLLILAAVLGLSVAASAQSKAVGARLGTGLEASYQHWVGDPNFIEITAGMNFINALTFRATGTYNWMLWEPDWTPRGNWGVYAGPGATLGSAAYEKEDKSIGVTAMYGIVGQLGLEYTFWFPLQLSVDLRPILFGYNGNFFSDCSNPVNILIPTISARYAF